MAELTRVLETSLYVTDLERSIRFYTEAMQLRKLVSEERFCALDATGGQVLLLFKQGASTTAMEINGGLIPPHDGRGQQHLAWAINADRLALWEQRLAEWHIEIEGRVQWNRGGTSIYFRDPDGHLLELVTPGCWPIY